MDKKYKIFQGRIEILWILLSLILLTLSAPEPMLAQRDTVPGPIDSMRNPSAVYCNMLGYTYRIKNSADGGQYGVCELPADTTCRAWDFLAGKCGKAYSICAKQGLEIRTLKDGKDPFLTEYAVCVNDEGNIIKSVTEMTNLLEQSGGVALNESFSMQPSTPRPEDAHTNDALPSSFDWRSYQGSNWLTPIKSQGICGS